MPHFKRLLISFSAVVFFSAGAITLVNAAEDSASNRPVGEFCSADIGFHRSLKLKADHTFSFDWSGCLGENGHTVGKSSLANGRIELAPAARMQPKTLLPIHWGDRIYLVESDKFMEFCNEINAGNEPRDEAQGAAFLRSGDEKKDVSGVPLLPSPWNDFILQKPLQGKIIRVIGQAAEVNLGAADGLKPGMALSGWGKTGADVTLLRVKSTTKDTALLEMEGMEHLSADERQLLWRIDTGQAVTSRYESPLKDVIEPRSGP